MADNGRSTGKLRNELNIPAVGDISKVLLSMANVDNDLIDLMNYRFENGNGLKSHSIKNLMLAALLDQKGDFKNSIPVLVKLLNVKGNILPITEDNVSLVGVTKDGKEILGEEEITKDSGIIDYIKYDKEISVSNDIKKSIKNADLIIFSSGSLLTSISPNLIIDGIVNEINESKAKKCIYVI